MTKHDIIKQNLMEEHKKLVSNGDLVIANQILYLLRRHKAVVGLDDISFEIEKISEKCGCHVYHKSNYEIAYISF